MEEGSASAERQLHPRLGTIYATTRLLEELGVIFFAHDETYIPPTCPASLPPLNITSGEPAFENRDGDSMQDESKQLFDIRQVRTAPRSAAAT